MATETFPYNIVVADKLYQKALNREPKYAEKFGVHFPRKQNQMMSDSMPLEEWIPFLKEIKDERTMVVLETNTLETKIGDGTFTNEQVIENLGALLTDLFAKNKELVNFQLSFGQETVRFEISDVKYEDAAKKFIGKSKMKRADQRAVAKEKLEAAEKKASENEE